MKPFSGSISRQIPPWPVFAWAVSISPLLQSRVLPVKPITGTTDHLRKPARECKYIFSLCYCITWSPPIAKSFKWKTCYPNLRPLLNSQSDFSIMILGFWFGIWANGFLLPLYYFGHVTITRPTQIVIRYYWSRDRKKNSQCVLLMLYNLVRFHFRRFQFWKKEPHFWNRFYFILINY